jgi:hypothetical protein
MTAELPGQATLFDLPAPAQKALATARAREDARAARHVPIDYPAAKAEHKQQKAALTRAVNAGDPEKVVLACRDAVRQWNAHARSWPDDWNRWQIALDDILGLQRSVLLEDLR